MENSTEIADLAESIGEQYIEHGVVKLAAIAENKNIPIIFGNYGDYFLGQLLHEQGNFFIYVNKDQLEEANPRTRFTIAHDLGHYFIDSHRNLLMSGISLTYNGFSKPKPQFEIEADHFASHLLMPKGIFKNHADKFDLGIPSVLSLKDYFNTSIECTAIHYVKLDILRCMLIKWDSDISKKYVICSPSLLKDTKIAKKPIIKFQKERIQRSFMEIEFSDPQIEYVETVTSLSKWVTTITPQSETDLYGIEQTFKLGNFGGITFLIFQ